MKDNDKILIESAMELRNWLQENHEKKESVWLVKWKKDSGNPYLSYDEIVDELMCFGWVDSLPKKLDEQKSMLRISPRNPKSNWSRVNKNRITRLLETGRIAPSGMELINLAKANGAWNFLDDVENLILPEDLKKALSSIDKAAYYFNRFPKSSKRGILEWIKNAKQDKTRHKRIMETAQKAAHNRKANFPKGRDAGPKEEVKD